MDYIPSKRQRLNNLVQALDIEAKSFFPIWQDVNDYVLPARGRFFVDDVNRGDRRNLKIIDSTATSCANILASGLMSGVTSPARPWFKLAVSNRMLMSLGAVKRWLDEVEEIIRMTFLRSNLYKVLPMCYKDLGNFGLGCIYVEEDSDKVMKFKSFPIGSFMIACDSDGMVNTFVRKFKYTAQQMVDTWGERDEQGRVTNWEIFSDQVKSLYLNGNGQEKIEITHVIKPNDYYDHEKAEWVSKYKKYYSCYYESGSYKSGQMADIDGDKYLSEKGYDYFPILAPRWSVTGEDVYCISCPAIDVIGDIKQLQVGEMRSLEAIDKQVNPPTYGPANLKGKAENGKLMAGEHVVTDGRGTQEPIKAAYQINFSVRELEEKQEQVRTRVEEAFHKPLFLAFARAERKSGTTAAEIYEIKDEKLLALGPTYEQLNQDLNDPLLDIAFQIHLKNGLLPPIPRELRGQEIKVEYISMMSQAQKMIGISSTERFLSFVGQVAQFDPKAKDKVNIDKTIDNYAEQVGVNPNIVNTDDEVAIIRQQQLEAMQQQQQQQLLLEGSQAAKNLSDAYVDGDNALSRMLGAVSG